MIMFYQKPLRIVASLLTIGSLLTLNACRDVQDSFSPKDGISSPNGRL